MHPFLVRSSVVSAVVVCALGAIGCGGAGITESESAAPNQEDEVVWYDDGITDGDEAGREDIGSAEDAIVWYDDEAAEHACLVVDKGGHLVQVPCEESAR
jgi:hypothetical protein